MPIYTGTAGYSYPEWIGPVYPEGTSASKLLEVYSGMFDVVEINSTYYRHPGARMFEKYPQRTGGELKIIVKLHQDFTHNRNAETGAAEKFIESVKPIQDSNQFLGYLAQFPQSFHCTKDAIDWLEKIRAMVPDSPVVCEFRHESFWKTDILKQLKELGFSVSSVDSPDLPGLPPNSPTYTNPPAYVRLHGRNAQDWHGSGMVPRYTYDYSAVELNDWKGKVKKIYMKSEVVVIIFNNHPHGFSAKNATEFIKLLREFFPDALSEKTGQLKEDDSQKILFETK